MRSLFYTWAIICFIASLSQAEPVTVLNHSFEYLNGQPVTVKTMGVTPDDWTFAGGPDGGVNGGIEAPSSDGEVCVAVGGTDSIFQLTDLTIIAGDEYALKVDAYYLWSSSVYDCTFQGRLYFDDGGSRTVIDYVEDTITTAFVWNLDYTLDVSIPSGSPAIGNKLGIELTATQAGDSWFGFDNVRLDAVSPMRATNPSPSNGALHVDPTVILRWDAPSGATSPITYDVYLGTEQNSLVRESQGQSETEYDPIGDLAEGTTFYWRIDVIESMIVYEGNIWSFTTSRPALTFYVDSVGGNDGNTGTSTDQAWASLTPVNNTTLGPGDMVLLKAGTTYLNQQLTPQGIGSSVNPVVIDRYGTGNKPRIDANGQFDDVVLLENFEYIEVSNLELTNTGATSATYRYGLRMYSNNYGTVHHVHVKNLDVHDVNGSNVKGGGEGVGILWKCVGPTPSNFDDILIEDCTLIRVDRNGIDGKSSFWQSDSYNPTTRTRSGGNWFPSTNVVVRGNYLEDIGGDCIKIISVDGGLCEYNVAYYGHLRATDCAAGIWNWSTDNVTFQFNEAAYQKGGCDGQGYDIDDNCTNTIMQYNYSHDNEGGFMLLCSAPDGVSSGSIGNHNSIVRYNISENDGDAENRVIHYCGQNMFDNYIYNNVFYLGAGQNATMVLFGNWGGYSEGPHYYWNNIFYADGTYSYSLGASNYFFEGNVYYGNHQSPPSDSAAIYDDPKLVAPGTGGSGIDSVDGYKLQAGSPAIQSGVEVTGNGGRDYWGILLDPGKAPDRGAHAYTHLPFPGDYNNDGKINLVDVSILFFNWLIIDSPCDLNEDGKTNIFDFSIMANNWMYGVY